MNTQTETCEGACGCGSVRYSIEPEPLIVHCCHCRWCQRQTGTAFALNALIEASRVTLLQGEVEAIDTPSPSGRGQTIVRCPTCRVAVWSHYFMGGLKERVCFIRVGTLDNPDRLPPDVHIFTSTKQPWVVLPSDDYAVDIYYDTDKTWARDSLKRLADLRELLVE